MPADTLPATRSFSSILSDVGAGAESIFQTFVRTDIH